MRRSETLERHGLELRNDHCTADCPTPERTENIQEEQTIREMDAELPHDLGNGQ